MRVLVCGGRDYGKEEHERRALFAYLDRHYHLIDTIIEGGARGADRLAREWAIHRDIPVITFEADWYREGKRAGIFRNIRMLEIGKPDVVVAFPGNRGTAHMMGIARKAGVIVDEVKNG